MSRASVMRAVVKNWETCQPNGVDSCASNGFVCCIAKDDLATRKSTCRPQNMCSDSNNNGNASGNKIADWQTCQLGRDSCSNSNYVCCVAQLTWAQTRLLVVHRKNAQVEKQYSQHPISDVGGPCNQAIQNAAVCRTGLVCNPPAVAMPGAAGTCALPNNNNGGGSQGGNKVADWQTCQQGRDSCVNNNYVCCVASADLGSNKATCRPQNDCGNNGGNNGNNNSGNNGGNNVGNKIADWQTCQFGRDSCLNNN
ncbi:hypothetical protein BCR33DRAFT_738444 [Rhizoclosmatium globosum]|uniref:Uncharacterized protein n=1 Tax=Rhizoclosmatium globosum TaxID=329046 RepID=A0A1Y2C9J2_9FUNG|nr:hypothetical protein BCR33DRAFT_738444 [Rhizoclosmatium globosum]|eukprot:ORY43702.1 hypothetical protein BCR33DRAFT_738444 [Rhizoclosmatium globosum]